MTSVISWKTKPALFPTPLAKVPGGFLQAHTAGWTFTLVKLAHATLPSLLALTLLVSATWGTHAPSDFKAQPK